VPLPREIARAGSTADLCEQFVLSRSLETPEGFVTQVLGAWRLAHHPTLPVITIRRADEKTDDAQEDRLGWLLGYPITDDGELLQAGSSIAMGAGDDPVRFVDALGGRFVAVLVGVAKPAIYPDAAGMYSSVFCPGLEVAASTPGLVPYTDRTGDRTELVEQLGIPTTNSMYPLGLTPRHGVRRLLPNHHVDLTTWTMVRHGPRWRERGSIGVAESVSRVAEIMRRNIAAVMDVYPCYLQLTAGHDSRMVLACARERRSEIATYTLRMSDLSARNDVREAARISEQIGVHHTTVRVGRANPVHLRRWVHRTGASVGEPRGWRADTALSSLERSRLHLAGNVGDLARLGYWGHVEGPDTPATTAQIAEFALVHLAGHLDPGQQRAAASPLITDEIEAWRDGAGAPDELALLDLLYVENRLGCWGGVWPYAQYRGPGFTFFPMNHREVVDLMMALPDDVRREESFNQLVIRHEWPDLLEIPFNDPARSVRAAHLPTRVARGLRRRGRDVRHRLVRVR
jgi:hypothetical protein